MQNQSSLNISNKSDQVMPQVVSEAPPAPEEEEFVELAESREIIEDRIFRLKI